jgi:TonB family protein
MPIKFIRPFLLIAASVCVPVSSPFAQDREHDSTVYELHNAGDHGITPPKGIYMPQPEYTDQARRKKIGGIVRLAFTVAPDGSVRDPVVTKSLDKGLDKRALETVQEWKFQPATKDGQAVTVRIEAEVSFHIR